MLLEVARYQHVRAEVQSRAGGQSISMHLLLVQQRLL